MFIFDASVSGPGYSVHSNSWQPASARRINAERRTTHKAHNHEPHRITKQNIHKITRPQTSQQILYNHAIRDTTKGTQRWTLRTLSWLLGFLISWFSGFLVSWFSGFLVFSSGSAHRAHTRAARPRDVLSTRFLKYSSAAWLRAAESCRRIHQIIQE